LVEGRIAGTCLASIEAARFFSTMAWATCSMNESPRCWQVAAKEANTLQVVAPGSVLLPQESLRLMTAGRTRCSRRLGHLQRMGGRYRLRAMPALGPIGA
jgi:hypothetical protein